MCVVCVVGTERGEKVERAFTRRRDEHFSESRKKAHALLALFPLFRSLTKREKREKKRRAERRELFSSFFFLRFFFTTHYSLLSSLFFLSLFSLSFLSLSSKAFVCVFLLEFSPHEIELFGGGSHSHPIIVFIFPRYKSKQQQQHAKRAFYSVNARNKNRDTRARFKAESPRENCSTDDIRLL